jgi:hypothetical protein
MCPCLATKSIATPALKRISFYEALKWAYPDHTWHDWKFTKTPVGFWRSSDNIRAYFDWLGSEIGLSKPDDWKALTRDVIMKHHGDSLLSYRKESVSQLLSYAFPEHGWSVWQLGQVPPHFWESMDNQRRCIEDVRQRLGISKPEDWYDITSDKFRRANGS